jgi:hypothetical protein
MCFDAPEAPRTDPRQYDLAEKQADMSKEMYEYTKERDKINDARNDEFTKTYIDPFLKQQMEQATKNMARSDEMYEYGKSTGRPALQRMFDDASNYDSAARIAEVRGQAASDAGQAMTTNLQAINRNMQRMGVNPENGRFAAAQGDTAAQLALAKVQAANASVRGLRESGMNARAAAAGMANGFGNQSINFSSAANASGASGLGAGQQGISNSMSSQAMFNSGMAGSSAIAGQAGNAYGNIFNQNLQAANYEAQNSTGAALGQLAGMGLNAYALGGGFRKG